MPGITSALAVPAYAGIPVTLRYSSTSVTIVTGHEDPAKGRTDVDWEALARVGGTIVILMGVAHLPRIVERVRAGGLAADTPVAAVRWGTRPDQVTVRAPLGTITEHPLRPPCTIVLATDGRVKSGPECVPSWMERGCGYRPWITVRVASATCARTTPCRRPWLAIWMR